MPAAEAGCRQSLGDWDSATTTQESEPVYDCVMAPETLVRPYEALAESLHPMGSRDQRMQLVVDTLFEALKETGVSWVGFYQDRPGEPDERRLVLGPCRDKPACSPIGLDGVCGKALLSRRPQIVLDIRDLGAAYIACDPSDRSEIVIPLAEQGGRCWGVLDLDSHDVAGFDESDERGLSLVLQAASFQTHQPPDC